jgi:DedD protein
MDEQLKHRLVGAAVIVLMAIVIVPLFFEDKTPKDSAALPEVMEEKALPLPEDKREASVESAGPTPSTEPPPKATVKAQKYEVVPLDEAPASKPPKTGSETAPPEVTPPEHDLSESSDESAPFVEDGIGVARPSPKIGPKTPSATPKALVGARSGAPAEAKGSSKHKSKPTANAANSTPSSVSGATGTRKGTPSPPGGKPGAAVSASTAKTRSVAPTPRSGDLPSKKPSVSASEGSVKTAKKPNTTAASEPNSSKAASHADSRWTVQVGTFADESNARKLVEKLQKRNLPVRMHTAEGGSGKVYRVTVGPSLDRVRAEQIQRQLSAQDGVNGMILQSR